MSHHVPWYFPCLVDGVVSHYTGPFPCTDSRDAYAIAFAKNPPPEYTLGAPLQAVANPNEGLPHPTAIVSSADGDAMLWSDGTRTAVPQD